MTRIEISDATYNEIKAIVVSRGLPESSVGAFAESKLREAVEQERSRQPLSPSPGLVDRFKPFRGMLRDTTVEEIVADRHEGLAR